jgi:hypothetical protein
MVLTTAETGVTVFTWEIAFLSLVELKTGPSGDCEGGGSGVRSALDLLGMKKCCAWEISVGVLKWSPPGLGLQI